VAGQEALDSLLLDERVVGESSDGVAPGDGIAKDVPRRQQVRVFLVELVFEPAEGSPALYGACRRRPARSPVIASAKSAMSWYQIQAGQLINADQVQFVEGAGVCPSVPVPAVKYTTSPVCG